MRHKAALLLVFCLAAVGILGIVASPASAGYFGLPHVGTSDVAHVTIVDGNWWTGGWGTYTEYEAGTPIPADKYVCVGYGYTVPNKSWIAQLPQILLLSVTVRADNGDIVIRTTEEQSAQFFSKYGWWPEDGLYYLEWYVPVGQLPAGTYTVTSVEHLQSPLLDENGDVALKPYKDIHRSSFTVQ